MTVHLAFLPAALIKRAIGPPVDAVAIHAVVDEATLVEGAIEPLKVTSAMLESLTKLARVVTSTIAGQRLCAFSIILAIDKLSFIGVAV